SVGFRITREPVSPQDKEKIVPVTNYTGYFGLDETSVENQFEGDFYVNSDGKYNNANYAKYIMADWNDKLHIKVAENGLINGTDVFTIPIPMPEAPYPPLPFKITNITAPSMPNGSNSTRFDFDGNVRIEWEKNVSESEIIYYYNVFVYRVISGDASQLVDNSSIGNGINNTINLNLAPGNYKVEVRAYNNSPMEGNPRINYNNIALSGDSGSEYFTVHAPPAVVTTKTTYSNSRPATPIQVEERAGANIYKIEYSRNKNFPAGQTNIALHTTNIIPAAEFSIDYPGVYYMRAAAGYTQGEITEWTDITKAPVKAVMIAADYMVGVVVNHDTAALKNDYSKMMRAYREMLIYAQLMDGFSFRDGNLTKTVYPVIIEDYSLDFVEKGFKTGQKEAYDEALDYSEPAITKIDSNDIQLINSEFLQGVVFTSTYIVSPKLTNHLNQINRILAVDMPGTENSQDHRDYEGDSGETISLNRNSFLEKIDIKFTLTETIDFNTFLYHNTQSRLSSGIPLHQSWGNHSLNSKILKAEVRIPSAMDTVYRVVSEGYDEDHGTGIVFNKKINDIRQVFINTKFDIDKLNMSFFEYQNTQYPEFDYKITHYDMLERALKFILDLYPDELEDIYLTYFDWDNKRQMHNNPPQNYYSKSTIPAGNSFTAYEVSGNRENLDIYNNPTPTMIRWRGDPNATSYEFRLINPPFGGADIIFDSGKFFTENKFVTYNMSGVKVYLWDLITPYNKHNLNFRLVSNNEVNENKDLNFYVRYSGAPENNIIKNGIWGDAETPAEFNTVLQDNYERAGYARAVIEKKNMGTGKYFFFKNLDSSFITPLNYPGNSVNFKFDSFSNNLNNISEYRAKVQYSSTTFTPDKGEEKSAEITIPFTIAPPKINFTSPLWNVDVNGQKYYETWNGNYMLSWSFTNGFNPPSNYFFTIASQRSSGGAWSTWINNYVGSDFNIFRNDQSGSNILLYRYRGNVTYNEISSEDYIYPTIIRVLPPPQLQLLNISSGARFYLNENPTLNFRVPNFDPYLSGAKIRIFIKKG
ncbi:MAG: hypothetical protein WCZ17_11405, partial [Candidatus Kapaibacterium sp.]